MNPNLELENVIYDTVSDWPADSNEELAAEIYAQIRHWMNRNQIVFYQP